MSTLYDTLGVAETATQDQIRKAYRRLVRTHHPDRGGDADRFRTITDARDTLCDPDKRAAYDRSLRAGTTNGPDLDDGAPPAAASPDEPPEPTWGTERTVRPDPPHPKPRQAPRPTPQPTPDPPPAEPIPSAVRRWAAPPLPPQPGKPRRSRSVAVIGTVGLGLYVAVLAAYVAVALSPLDVTGVPFAVTVLAIICLRRALSARAGATWIIAEIVMALPAVASISGVLDAPVAAWRDGSPNSLADIVSMALGWSALVIVGAMILATELWRADRRHAVARNAAAWDFYHQACRTRELAEHWQQMLLKSAVPGQHLRWIVNAFPTATKTHALLEDPRTGRRANHWLWGTWNPGTWVVVQTRTDDVLHWAAPEARAAWDQIGPRP